MQTVYTTQVTTPSPRTTTTSTVTVTSYNNDLSFYLDLQAVAAAFAESRSVQEFERLLNSSRYMINNLDLNRDGFVDYLRVIETHRGYYHTFLIQACLSPTTFQDVATVVTERLTDRLYVEVIGDRYLYGYNYIVRPVFHQRPPMWDVFGRPQYNPWVSPYHHGHWPDYYHQAHPIYLNHYQAYVNTYMHNHHYCNHCDYPQQPYYNGYTQMTNPHTHNDYATQHPNDSFDQRVTHTLTANGSGVSVRNAGQLRTETERQQSATQTKQTPAAQTTTSGTSARTANSGTTTTSTANTGSATSTRTQTTTTTSRTSVPTTTRTPSTSVSTRVNKSGETRTTIKQTDAEGRTSTVQRTSTTSRTSGSSTRTSDVSSGSSTRTSGSSSGSSSRTTDNSSRQSGSSSRR